MTPLTSSELNDRQKITSSTHSAEDKQTSWYSVTFITATLLFILLNIIPPVFDRAMHAISPINNPVRSLSYARDRLEKYVKTSSYENEKAGPWPWWVARAYFDTPSPDIVTMGDSQINAAFIQADAIASHQARDCACDRDCFALKKSLEAINKKNEELHLVNLAVGGAMPSDYYLMSRAFFTEKDHPKVAILAISPRSFVDATLSDASSTETFQFLSPYVDLGPLDSYAFGNVVEKYFWQLKNQLSFFKYRDDIILTLHNYSQNVLNTLSPPNDRSSADAKANKVPPIYGGSGMIALGSNVVLPNPNVPFRGNEKEYRKRFSVIKPQTFESQEKYFAATVQYLNQLGTKVIVVDMPILEPVRNLLPSPFWQNTCASLKATSVRFGATWLDLYNDPRFNQKDFIDYVHLNSYGGQKFVDILAKSLLYQPNTLRQKSL